MKGVGLTALGVSAVALLLTAVASLKTVESGTVGIKVTLGKYDNEELPPGLHFKIPLVQSIKIADVRVHTIHYKGKKDLPDKEGVIYKPSITVLDERGLPINVELTVQYRILPDLASETIQSWGWNWEEKLVNPAVRDIVRDVIGQYPAEKIPVKRQEIATKIEQGIRDLIKESSKSAVQVVGVQLRNILLPFEIQQKIKEVQIAKQEAEKMKYVEEKARKEQEVRKIKAETEKIERVIKAEAEAQAKIKEAEAIAKANELISKSVTSNLLRWKEIEVQMKVAESLKENPNVRLFLNVPKSGNFHLWLDSQKRLLGR